MNHTDLQSSTIESAYESILQCLRYGPSHSVNITSDWMVIKQAFRKITPDPQMGEMSNILYERITNIIDFIEKESNIHFGPECWVNPHGRTLYQDILQCASIYHPHKLNRLLEQILQNHLDPFVQISIFKDLKDVVPDSLLMPRITHVLDCIERHFESTSESDIHSSTEWDIDFWSDLLPLLDHFNQSFQPWISILQSFPETHEKYIWLYRLTENFYKSIGTLAEMSSNKRDRYLLYMLDHFIDIPHRRNFAFHEIEDVNMRCDAGIHILEESNEIAESTFWQIHDCICHYSQSWYQFGMVLSYGVEYDFLDMISLTHIHQAMNQHFHELGISTDTIEWDISNGLLEEWNTLVKMKTA